MARAAAGAKKRIAVSFASTKRQLCEKATTTICEGARQVVWIWRLLLMTFSVGLAWLSYESSQLADHYWATTFGVMSGFIAAVAAISRAS